MKNTRMLMFISIDCFQEAQADLDMFNQTVQMLAHLSQSIARESGEHNASMEMNSLLQICVDKLHTIREMLPIVLKRNQILLGHLQKFDDSFDRCQQWLNNAHEHIAEYSLDVSIERLETYLEQHRVTIRSVISFCFYFVFSRSFK
jgi:hypothetical protein